MLRKRNYCTLIGVLLYSLSIVSQTATSTTTITAVNDFDTAEINTTLTVDASEGVLKNDTDSNSNNSLTVTEFSVNENTFSAGQTANFTEGSITLNADGSFTFVPTTGYTGDTLPPIIYTVSNGKTKTTASLWLTVEHITNLLEVSGYNSCNQGYTANGEYKIRYFLSLRNKSTARDYHENNLIKNVNLTKDILTAFGNGCINTIEDIIISTDKPDDYIGKPYPQEFSNSSLNPNFESSSSNQLFSESATKNNTLYPRQAIYISFCVSVKPFCDGRPNPTPSGSGIDFNTTLNATSTIGNATQSLSLKDFHTAKAIVSAGLHLAEPRNPDTGISEPVINPDGTYDYTNTIIITNEGTETANNVNYNMGLGSFFNNGITFKEHKIKQVSGPSVNINPAYNGNTNTLLLLPNNNLPPKGTIILEVYSLTDIITPNGKNSYFYFPSLSQTQGAPDGFDETAISNKNEYSYVVWSDDLGNHLDTYQMVESATTTPSSNLQCYCATAGMTFTYTSSASIEKTITNTEEAPNGILEHEKVTFQITVTNTSPAVQLTKLNLQSDFNSACTGKIVSVATPVIKSSTATQTPTLNTNYNGTSDIELFNGTSGILKPKEKIVIELAITFGGDCNGTVQTNFSGQDPLLVVVNSSASTEISFFNDKDNDGVSDSDDIDDDNDTIPDILEYNGVNPTADDDNDNIPNYRDTDYGADANNDGIVDVFDFDGDGIPNHFDLDSDNDGILDIVEAGNTTLDTNKNGRTNNPVGANGLDNTIESNDTPSATITYTIKNTDTHGQPDFIDIDADADGIVDNIEGQATASYIAPNNTVNASGIDTAYPNGITPVDTENDGTPDYIDINSDNDVRNDIIEGWDFNNDGTAETTPTNTDADNDGLDDAFDKDNTQVNPTNGQTPTDFPNVDKTSTPERDWREKLTIVLAINNVSAKEGENLVFTISLVTGDNQLIESNQPTNIILSTSNGTTDAKQYNIAVSPFDYNAVSATTVIIPAFQSTMQYTVTTNDDIIYELDEKFTLNATITSSNTTNTETKGIGTIISDELPPAITMNSARANEGEDLKHTVTISHPASSPISVEVSTSDDTAKSPNDYTETKKTVTIEGTTNPDDANTQVSFNIPTKTDNINEPDEEYLNVIGTVITSNVSEEDLNKKGTILDIDPDPIVEISNATVVEGEPLQFTIRLLNANSEPMLNYLPINFSLKTIDVTATSPSDYTALAPVTKSIPAFTPSIDIFIKTIDDNINEETETMILRADITSRGVSNSSFIIKGTGFIKDNDTPNLFSPNNDGRSDVFRIGGIEDFPNFKLDIFDRWGSKVYSYKNMGRTNPRWWNGKKNGFPVPAGVYYYILDYNDGKTKPRTNFIELIR